MTIPAADEPRFRVPPNRPEKILDDLTDEQAKEHLRALHSVTESALAHLALPELLRELLSRLRAILTVDTATILLCTNEGTKLEVRASSGLEDEVEQHVEIPIGQGIAGTVAARREAAIVDDVSQFETVSPLLRRLTSMMAAPLIDEGDLLGVLHVGTLARHHFTTQDLYLLQVVADRAALSIHNALTFERQTAALQRMREAELAVQGSEARWRTLAEVDPNGIVVIDDQSVILATNPALEGIFGYGAGELVGQPLAILIPERLRNAHHGGTERYLRTGRRNIPWSGVEVPALTKTGREITIRISFGEYTEGDRHVFAGFIQDLTESKRAEAHRRAEHNVTRILATAVPPLEIVPGVLTAVCEALGWEFGTFWEMDAVERGLRCAAVWHLESKKLDSFAEASRVTRLEPGEGLPGRVWQEAHAVWVRDVVEQTNFPRVAAAAAVGLHAALAFPLVVNEQVAGVIELFGSEIQEPDEALLRTLEVIGHDVGQYLYRRRAEEERDRALTGAIEARKIAEEHAILLEEVQVELEMANGELQGANEALVERTREAERERALAEEANRAKSGFLAAMSHELRTPLNAIGGYADLLLMGLRGPLSDLQRADLERIDRSGRHLLGLINEVLNYARLESGFVRYDLRPTQLSTVVADTVPLIEPQLAAKGITLDVRPRDPGGARLVVLADPEKVQQILLNLLSNAVKFTPEGGQVRVELMEAVGNSGMAGLRVADDGIGIPADQQESIFEPFVQVGRALNNPAEGTGLGLTISRDLARAMGGELTVESTSGTGSTFVLTLPQP